VLPGLVFAVGVSGLGVAVMRLADGQLTAWRVGALLVLSGLVIAVGVLLHGQREAVERKLNARRRPYQDPATGRWVSYGFIANLSTQAKHKRFWVDDKMARWFVAEHLAELEVLSIQTRSLGRWRRVWLKVMLPDRLRPPIMQLFVCSVLPGRVRRMLFACRRWLRQRRGKDD
jgi:hypothetical protein